MEYRKVFEFVMLGNIKAGESCIHAWWSEDRADQQDGVSGTVTGGLLTWIRTMWELVRMDWLTACLEKVWLVLEDGLGTVLIL